VDGMNNCTQCDELKKRVNHIEYEDLKEIRGDIQEIREDMAKSHVLLKQNIDSSEKLNNTLTTVQNTMIQLSENIKHTNETTSALSSKVSNLEEKIDKVENHGKLDMMEWWQNNWVNVIILVGVVAYVVLGQYIAKF
jgi:predicted nuclease with TOPRIM domain